MRTMKMKISKELISTTSSGLDASSLHTGMYILKIESTDGEIQTKKIIKKEYNLTVVSVE